MNLSNLSVRDLKNAVTLKTRLEKLQSQLSDLLGGNGKPGRKAVVEVDGRKRRRKMSAAARAKIAAAQRARWAKVRTGNK